MKPAKSPQRASNTHKARSTSAEANTPGPFTPFELALTAIVLREVEMNHPGKLPAFGWTGWFQKAHDFLGEARQFLQSCASDGTKKIDEFTMMLRYGTDPDEVRAYQESGWPIPFEKLVRPRYRPKGAKKPRSWLGDITKLGSLEKAVRHYFDKESAARIIRAQALSFDEYEHLLKAKKQAVQTRAAKRGKVAVKIEVQKEFAPA